MNNPARHVVIFLFVAFHCSLSQGQSLSGTVNNYYQVTGVNMAANSVTLSSATGLSTGQRVMLYQAKGAVINSANSSTYGDITSLNTAGGYELNTICSITGNQVWLVNALANSYDPTAQVQLVTVPSSSSITVAGTITGAAWNPSSGTGGIVVLESSGTIFLNADISVSGQGFQGGALVNYAIPPYDCSWAVTVSDYYLSRPTNGDYTGGMKGEGIAAYILNELDGRGKLANGGGGGDNGNSGGAGGGNFGLGGNGGQRTGESYFDCHAQYPGIGGAALSGFGYSAAANRIFFGGGGGSGQENNAVGTPGANGGGIILLSAPTIAGGGGRLIASGLQPVNPTNTDPSQAEGDGGGGGGAGGTIVLNTTTVSGSITANVSGGRGSNSSNLVNDCTGPGGGGAGGVIWASGGSFPAAVSSVLSGGANGVVSSGSSKTACVGSSNGATSGASGVSQTGFVFPASTGSVCATLATPALADWTATRTIQGVLLSWDLASSAPASEIRQFIIQRSFDGSQFDSLATMACPSGQTGFQFTDAGPGIDGPLAYRLAWSNSSGERVYSKVVAVPGKPGPDAGSLRLYPNPATDQLMLTVISTTTEKAVIRIANSVGQTLRVEPMLLHSGLNTASISVRELAPGTYFLLLEAADRHAVKVFIRRTM